MTAMEGLVMKSTGSWYLVRLGGGEILKCRLRGKLKLKGSKTTNPVAVGDSVILEKENDREGIINDIQPRQNYLIRKSAQRDAFGHIIASNIDQAILVVTLSFPRTSIGFIDRYLVSTESFRIPTRIIFNKSDLLDPDLTDTYKQLSGLYETLGYPTLLLSARNDQDFSGLQQWLTGKTSLFSGHSGVGKSSLLNRLDPELNLVTREVSTFANKGTHATTFATMFDLGHNTLIIDTPGIRELGMIDMEDWEISHYFPEMREQLNNCKYHNCLHINEPGCKVLQLLQEGKIAESRYKSYVGMVYEEDSRK